MAVRLQGILGLKSVQYTIAHLVLNMVGRFWCPSQVDVAGWNAGGVAASWWVHPPLSHILMLYNDCPIVEGDISLDSHMPFSRPIDHVALGVITVSDPVALVRTFVEFTMTFAQDVDS